MIHNAIFCLKFRQSSEQS